MYVPIRNLKKARVIIFAVCAVCTLITFAKADPASDMPNIKITDARMVQVPDFSFILPNSEIQLSVHQQISSTTFDVASRYDMLNTFFHIGFDLRYNFAPFFAGGALDDTIYFELNLGPKTYFERVHNIIPYFGYKLGRFTELKVASSFGNTLTASVDNTVDYDKGNVLLESVGIKYDTSNVLNPVPNGSMLSATLYGSYCGLGSDYEYTKGEIEAKNTYMPRTWDYLESDFKYYFPMTTDLRPISDVYLVGGYDILRGYNYREFYGDTLVYGRLNYHIPIVRNVKEKALRAKFRIMTIDLTGETAQIGNARDLGNVYNLKSSVSAGLGCDVVLFEHVNIKFSTFSAKALEANRTPVFYFILTAYTYLFV